MLSFLHGKHDINFHINESELHISANVKQRQQKSDIWETEFYTKKAEKFLESNEKAVELS